MARTALYQKYRSSTFDEVVGQEHIVQAIKNAIKQEKVTHAYLFCGPRGTGKTTMARILAKAVNCENKAEAPCEKCENCLAANDGTHPDIIEINAANETHVENIRDLIERARLAPMQGENKIYIIDEVHQLSSAASSALLKTLEEPPENVIFILATTDPQKLLPTIISRCQRYDFTKITTKQIANHLMHVANSESIKLEESAAYTIAQLAEGGMRDALSILDQSASYSADNITEEEIERVYGLSTNEEKLELIKDMLACNVEGVIKRVETYEEKGIDLQRFTDGLIDILKDTVVFGHTQKSNLLKTIDVNTAADLLEVTNVDTCMQMAEELLQAKEKYKFTTSAINCFEVVCLALATREKPLNKGDERVSEIKPVVTKEHASMDVKEPEKKETITKEVETKKYSQEDILSLLVQCNKEEKQKSEDSFAKLSSIEDLSVKKYIALLNDVVVGPSGKDCVLLITKSDAISEIINEAEMNKELYMFTREYLNNKKMLFALTENELKDATEEFRNRMQTNTLPEAMKIKKYKAEKKSEQTPEEKVIELFGEENVEIIGGE